MKFTMRPKNKEKEVYVLKIKFEHGDCEMETFDEVRLEGYSKKEAQEYLIEFDKVSNQIYDQIDKGVGELDPRIEKEEYSFMLSTGRESFIPTCQDQWYNRFNNNDDCIMATMIMEEVVYFDEDGDVFDVSDWQAEESL